MIEKDDIHWEPLNITDEARRGRNFLIGLGWFFFVMGFVVGIVVNLQLAMDFN